MKRSIQIGLLILISFVLVGLTLILIAGQLVPTSNPRSVDDSPNTFPILEGTNLLLEKISIPSDLEGEYKLIVVAYDTDQQIFVDKWLLPLEELNAQYPQLAGYYLPLLPQDTADAAFPIIGGMTLAASNDRNRARTIVVFTDVSAFNDLTGIPDVSQVQLFLLDQSGAIRWQGSGAYHPDTLASLEATLAELNS